MTTTYRSRSSASLYAFVMSRAMSARSIMKRSQLRKLDQQSMRWRIMRVVKRRADCQAWNLKIALVSNVTLYQDDAGLYSLSVIRARAREVNTYLT